MNNIAQVWPAYIQTDITTHTEVVPSSRVGGGKETNGTVYTQLVVACGIPFERSAPIMGKLSRIRPIRYLLLQFSNCIFKLCNFCVLWIHCVVPFVVSGGTYKRGDLSLSLPNVRCPSADEKERDEK